MQHLFNHTFKSTFSQTVTMSQNVGYRKLKELLLPLTDILQTPNFSLAHKEGLRQKSQSKDTDIPIDGHHLGE